MVIYLDVLLAVNWVIDFLLLHAVARFLTVPREGWRLVLGAAVGAAACTVVLLPELSAPLSVAVKFGTAVAMSATAFGRHALLKRTAVLFLFSTAAAGAATAVWWLVAPRGLALINGVIYYDIPPLLLIGLVAATYGLLYLYTRWTRRRDAVGRQYRLRICRAGKTVEVPAMYDSGNRLTEPFSGAPVVVAAYPAVASLVTPAWREDIPPPGARVIPFTSVGGAGMLPAFRPEQIQVISEKGEWDITGSFVAVTSRPLHGGYDALIGTAAIATEPEYSKKRG